LSRPMLTRRVLGVGTVVARGDVTSTMSVRESPELTST
jgi:hypothetical protein